MHKKAGKNDLLRIRTKFEDSVHFEKPDESSNTMKLTFPPFFGDSKGTKLIWFWLLIFFGSTVFWVGSASQISEIAQIWVAGFFLTQLKSCFVDCFVFVCKCRQIRIYMSEVWIFFRVPNRRFFLRNPRHFFVSFSYRLSSYYRSLPIIFFASVCRSGVTRDGSPPTPRRGASVWTQIQFLRHKLIFFPRTLEGWKGSAGFVLTVPYSLHLVCKKKLKGGYDRWTRVMSLFTVPLRQKMATYITNT